MPQGRVVEDAVKKIDIATWVGSVCDEADAVVGRRFDVTVLRNAQRLVGEKGTAEISLITGVVTKLNEALLYLKEHKKQQVVDLLLKALKEKLQAFRKEVAAESSRVPSVPLSGGAGCAVGPEPVGDEKDEVAEDFVVIDALQCIDDSVDAFSVYVDGLANEMLVRKSLSAERQTCARFIYDWIGFLKFKLAPYKEIGLEKADEMVSGGVYYTGLDGVKNTLQIVLAYAKRADSSRFEMRVHDSFKDFLRNALLFLLEIDGKALFEVMRAFFCQKVPVVDEECSPSVAPVKKGIKLTAPPSRREKKLEAREKCKKARDDAAFLKWLEEADSLDFYNSLLKK